MRFEIPAASGRKKMVIEAPATANLNYFLKTALLPITSGDATVSQVQVKTHQRRSYPGDTTTTTVAASNREYLVDKGRKSGNSLGGFTFTLVTDAGLPGEERRSFTLVEGRVLDLHSFLVGQAKYQTQLFVKSGTRYVIEATSALANP